MQSAHNAESKAQSVHNTESKAQLAHNAGLKAHMVHIESEALLVCAEPEEQSEYIDRRALLACTGCEEQSAHTESVGVERGSLAAGQSRASSCVHGL